MHVLRRYLVIINLMKSKLKLNDQLRARYLLDDSTTLQLATFQAIFLKLPIPQKSLQLSKQIGAFSVNHQHLVISITHAQRLCSIH